MKHNLYPRSGGARLAQNPAQTGGERAPAPAIDQPNGPHFHPLQRGIK